jgi:hypothetical protein
LVRIEGIEFASGIPQRENEKYRKQCSYKPADVHG